MSAAETSRPVAEAPVVTATGQKIPAYNAFEFSYRPDFGKIILLQQNVETGQAVTQVPTEYHLRQYAVTQRQQRVQQFQKLYQGSVGESQERSAAPAIVLTTTAAKSAAAPSSPASAASASPSVAPSTVAAATAAHVDIKA